MASLLSLSSLSFSINHVPQPNSASLNRQNQPSFLRISTRPLYKSNLHKSACTKTPQSFLPLLQSLAKNSAFLLVGSFLFLGQFHFKPALAIVASQNGNISSPLEEQSQNNKKKNKHYDEVTGLFERYLEKHPRDVETLKIVLYGKLRKGNMEEALKYIQRLEILEPGEVEWRLLEAVAYEIMGRLSEAKKVYSEILDETPLCTRALHGLALVMHKNQEGPTSLQLLNEALELASRENRVTKERNIKILIAMMHFVKGDLDEALKKFEDMTNEDPKDFRPYLCKGIIYSLLDKKKEADLQLEMYKSLVPDEFPQKGFLEDCIRAARTDSHDQISKELLSAFSART